MIQKIVGFLEVLNDNIRTSYQRVKEFHFKLYRGIKIFVNPSSACESSTRNIYIVYMFIN